MLNKGIFVSLDVENTNNDGKVLRLSEPYNVYLTWVTSNGSLLFMEHDFFKHTISNGLQFYFKPLLDSTESVYYEVKGYRNNVKAFKIVQKEKDKDGHNWEFAHEAQVPDAIKKMESEFLDAIVAER